MDNFHFIKSSSVLHAGSLLNYFNITRLALASFELGSDLAPDGSNLREKCIEFLHNKEIKLKRQREAKQVDPSFTAHENYKMYKKFLLSEGETVKLKYLNQKYRWKAEETLECMKRLENQGLGTLNSRVAQNNKTLHEFQKISPEVIKNDLNLLKWLQECYISWAEYNASYEQVLLITSRSNVKASESNAELNVETTVDSPGSSSLDLNTHIIDHNNNNSNYIEDSSLDTTNPRIVASSSKRGKKNHLVARVRSQRKSSTRSRDEIVDATYM